MDVDVLIVGAPGAVGESRTHRGVATGEVGLDLRVVDRTGAGLRRELAGERLGVVEPGAGESHDGDVA